MPDGPKKDYLASPTPTERHRELRSFLDTAYGLITPLQLPSLDPKAIVAYFDQRANEMVFVLAERLRNKLEPSAGTDAVKDIGIDSFKTSLIYGAPEWARRLWITEYELGDAGIFTVDKAKLKKFERLEYQEQKSMENEISKNVGATGGPLARELILQRWPGEFFETYGESIDK